jgi:hypothetical protein
LIGNLFETAKILGVKAKTTPDRIGPLDEKILEKLGLTALRNKLKSNAGRKVDFMLFRDSADAWKRASSLPLF